MWAKCIVLVLKFMVDCVCNVMAHAQKPDFVFRRNGRVHLYRRGRQFSRLLAAEVCASAVVMLGTPCSEVVWRVLATHSIRQFLLHFPSRALPCAITFQLDSTYECLRSWYIKEETRHCVQMTKSFKIQHPVGRYLALSTSETHEMIARHVLMISTILIN